ncbi:MAG: MFS transporter [Burkholderiales bacterium]
MTRDRYGWVVVLCAFGLMFTGFGIAYSFAAFFQAFQAEFGAPRVHVSLVFSLCALLWFSTGVPGGMLADRFGPRGVCLAGVICLAAGPALGAQASSVEILYLTYSIGVGVGIGLSYVPSVGAVQRWFTANRAFATGIAVSGIGAGNLAFPPLAAWWISLFGWRGAYLALAGLTLALALPAALAVENRRMRPGMTQGGAPLPGVALGAALRSQQFWLLYCVALLICVGFFVPMVHLVPYASDHGYSEAQGITLVSLLGLGSLLGRFAVAGIADRLGHMRSLVGLAAGLGAMFLLWWVAQSYWALAVFAILFGSLYGGYVALAPTLCMDLFGARNVAGIIGCLYTAAGFGTLIGPTLAGAAFDAYGSYDAPILACAVLSFTGAALGLGLAGARPAHASA